MKIAAVQLRSIAGQVEGNLDRHLRSIEAAASANADLILFPELSSTGYHPSLASEVAVEPLDSCFDVVQRCCDSLGVAAAIGVPTRHGSSVRISHLLFQPRQERLIYSKRYLHADEESYFAPGKANSFLWGNNERLSIAICYELSVPQHAEDAAQHGACIYAACVAKTSSGVSQARQQLATIATRHSMTTLMVNAVGPAENLVCSGGTAAWDSQGVYLGGLDEDDHKILLVDTAKSKANILH